MSCTLPIYSSGWIHSPLTGLVLNDIAEGPVRKKFKNFSNRDLAIIALCLEEEDKRNRRSSMENGEKRRFGKRRFAEGELSTLLPHLLDEETTFYQYFRM